MGYGPWGHKELDMTKQLNTHIYNLTFLQTCHESQMFVFLFGLCFINLKDILSPLNLLVTYHFSPYLIMHHLILLSFHPFRIGKL